MRSTHQVPVAGPVGFETVTLIVSRASHQKIVYFPASSADKGIPPFSFSSGEQINRDSALNVNGQLVFVSPGEVSPFVWSLRQQPIFEPTFDQSVCETDRCSGEKIRARVSNFGNEQ